MFSITHDDGLYFLLAIGIILLGSRLAGELFRKIGMPIVLGEIVAGIVLGKSVLGNLAPDLFNTLFPFINDPVTYSQSNIALETLVLLAITMLMFVAGIEVNLAIIIKKRRTVLLTTFFSMVIPMVAGIGIVFVVQDYFFAVESPKTLGIFIGLLLSVTALPIVAKILMDLNLFNSPIGITIISSSMLIDLLGWIGFSVVINTIDPSLSHSSIWILLISLLVFGIVVLTIGTRTLNFIVPLVQDHFSWPGGILAILLSFCFLGATFTQYIGVHYVLGAFIVGISVGDCHAIKHKTMDIIHQFVLNIFAPFFFAYLGLKIDFFSSFNVTLFLGLFALAFVTKILGSSIGARLSGLNRKDSLAIGFGMNTHGSLEIILSSIAYENGLINKEFFVAIMLVIISSIILAAPFMKWATKNSPNASAL